MVIVIASQKLSDQLWIRVNQLAIRKNRIEYDYFLDTSEDGKTWETHTRSAYYDVIAGQLMNIANQLKQRD